MARLPGFRAAHFYGERMSVVTSVQRRLGVGRRRLDQPLLPRHVGVIIDGNRRWAKTAGYPSAHFGHRIGAEQVGRLLEWTQDAGIEHLTVYAVSADNLRSRPAEEVSALHEIIRTALPRAIEQVPGWQLHLSGDLDLLPAPVVQALRAASARTAGQPRHVTLAVGYDGRQDIVDAVRTALLRDSGSRSIASLDADRISAALAGGPVKDIDLVIRTGGEQRLCGFCPWQTTQAQVVVSGKLWPAFARRDFSAALRRYAEAQSRTKKA